MPLFRPEHVNFKGETEKDLKGKKVKTTRRLGFDTEDIIAFFAGIVAIIFALGIVFGKVPINSLTIGVLGFAGVGAVIAEIIKARKRKKGE